MKPPGIIVTSLLVTVGYAGLFAARPDLPPPPVIEQYTLPQRSVALDEATIRRFLYGYAPVAATLRELEDEGDASARISALDAKASEVGFASFRDWADIATTIMVTYNWAVNPEPAREVDKVVTYVTKMSEPSDSEKAAMISGLRTGLSRVSNAKPSAANLAVVRRHLRTLKPIYNQWKPQES
ncbi:hypothetical protein M8997_020795 [Phyllobacterium sp. 21LDTY02-6]|uniref:hypothetical protein n=1 Tax=unclassified Phyllobacterium TaxID=2638441 RepID=UPI002021CAD1|nr:MULTISPECIES: hypothetical protein [unclassified Phyllobacterium]MCO4319630.1 hypothetical protein [Phyllobacterium sp. 21LDTY02-6]MCX8280374.1 hypothetical protein [Phyllobacterium sp. 0TCS1.6C]MCX8295177.1 hypothetical protein [Phyllobacterium sp. 0TCS1.6A]